MNVAALRAMLKSHPTQEEKAALKMTEDHLSEKHQRHMREVGEALAASTHHVEDVDEFIMRPNSSRLIFDDAKPELWHHYTVHRMTNEIDIG